MTSIATPYLMQNFIPVPETGCWLWSGAWSRYGYGKVNKHGRIVAEAHRLFYMVHVGPIPEGACICHKCDTPACVNPDHLFIGTQADNMKDMAKKNRGRKKPVGGVKLSASDAQAIYKSTLTRYELAAMYEVSAACISKIKRGHTWSNATGHKEPTARAPRNAA